MKSGPFFIPKIMKNTSGDGPETIPVFCHLFSRFFMVFTSILGSFWAKRLVADVFLPPFWGPLFVIYSVAFLGRHFRRPGELRRRPGPILGAPEPSRTPFSSLFAPFRADFWSFSGDLAGLSREACRT